MVSGNPSATGSRAEMAVTSAMHRSGREVYVPLFAPHGRVDLIVSDSAALTRVQVKSARLFGGSLFFRTCSNTANEPRHYRGEVDAFGVYAPDLDLVYLVPVELGGLRGCTLRLEPARNGQQRRINWATDYLVGPP